MKAGFVIITAAVILPLVGSFGVGFHKGSELCDTPNARRALQDVAQSTLYETPVLGGLFQSGFKSGIENSCSEEQKISIAYAVSGLGQNEANARATDNSAHAPMTMREVVIKARHYFVRHGVPVYASASGGEPLASIGNRNKGGCVVLEQSDTPSRMKILGGIAGLKPSEAYVASEDVAAIPAGQTCGANGRYDEGQS